MAAESAPKGTPPTLELRGELGRGSMGVVYRAFDRTLGKEVAVKVLPPDAKEPDRARRFQREATDLATLAHPNVVGFYGVGRMDDHDYLVMELVDSGNLNDFLDRNPTLVAVLDLFAQIADGLEHIHHHGIVHRDLKPENILVTADGVPKITDFGLARRLESRSHLTNVGTILGTYTYISPEQILSSEVGPATDLYAMGACLYEALVGHPMFEADTEFAMLNKHLRDVPDSPRSQRPELPIELESLVLRLVKKTPEERPASAGEVARSLRSILAHERGREQVDDGLRGRAAEMERLAALVGRARQGQAVSVLLSATHGLGRTRLLMELVPSLVGQGLRVVLVSPRPDGGLQPLMEAVVALGGSPEEVAQALVQAGPAAAAGRLRELLTRSKTPTILIMDGLTALGPTTLEVARSLIAMAPPEGHGWLISAVTSLVGRFSPQAATEHVELLGLDAAVLIRLAEQTVRKWPEVEGGDVTFDPDLTNWLVSRAAGSVRRIRLLLLSLRGDRALEFTQGKVSRREGAAWPAQIHESAVLELDRLDEGQLKFLRAASLLGTPIDFEVARAAAEVSEEEADHALDSLVALGVLEEVRAGEWFSFSSSQIRETLVKAMSERARRRLHSKLCEALAARGYGPGVQARHRALGLSSGSGVLPSELPLNLYLEGGRLLQEQGAFPEAYEIWREAGDELTHWPAQSLPGEVRYQVWMGQAECLSRMGRKTDALRLLETVLGGEAATEPGEAMRLRMRAAARFVEWLADSDRGGLPEARRQARDSCRAMLAEAALPLHPDAILQDHPLMAEACELYRALAVCLRDFGERSNALVTLDALQALAPDPATLYWQGVVRREQGDLEGSIQSLQTALASDTKGPYRRLRILAQLGLSQSQGGPAAAAASLAEARELAEQLLDLGWQARIWSYLADVHEQADDLEAAAQARSEAVATLRATSFTPQLALALVRLGDVRLEQEQVEAAETAYREALSLCGQFQGDTVMSETAWGLGRLYEQRGRPTEACEWYGQAQKLGLRLQDVARQGRALSRLSRLLLRSGKLPGAIEKAGEAVTLLDDRPDMRYELGLALSAQGLSYLASGDPDSAGPALERALVVLSDGPGTTATRGLKRTRNQVLLEVQEALDKLKVQAAPDSQPVSQEPAAPAVVFHADTTEPALPPARPGISSSVLTVGAVLVVGVVLLLIPSLTRRPVPPTPTPNPLASTEVTPTTTPAPVPTQTPATPSPAETAAPSPAETAEPSPAVTALDTPAETPAHSPTQAGQLQVSVTPADAELSLTGPDGIRHPQQVGELKLQSLAPGSYKLRAQRTGYVSQDLELAVEAGTTTRKEVSLVSAGLGRLQVQVKPTQAVLKVDGKSVPLSAGRYDGELSTGNHSLTVWAKGYTAQTLPVEVKKDETLEKSVELKRFVATLLVKSNQPGARVYLDGQLRGQSPLKLGNLPPGPHQLKVVKDGYYTFVETIKLESDQDASRTAQLKAIPPPPPPPPRYVPPPPRYVPPPPPYRPPAPPPARPTRPDEF